ncbi:aldehyde oxidase 1 isoform X2 [Heterocephalus glaber]|uniref:aldehyde oxidase n=1 Tax=Heterocephalus glaber TaxID=10181 RepID=A0AAX6S5U6_HETGA|nr:aldehyde oxidase 1 isoform X2 [Heterocephalus glaber]
MEPLHFFVNGRRVTEKNVDPEMMLLPFLRRNLRLTGTKYGCGGGGCGACTVMISRYDHSARRVRHYPASACLTPVCSLHGAAVTTVEGVGSTRTRLHPVQERIAKSHGTQCGFCTPGMVMSLYTLLRNYPQPSEEQLLAALAGNLCRCTGYRPILDAGRTFCKTSGCCQSKENEVCCLDQGVNRLPEPKEGGQMSPKLFSEEEFLPLDPTQELIFPPELMILAEKQPRTPRVFTGDRMTWISPVTLEGLLEAKSKFPHAPLVMGNTSVGLTLGAGLSLAQMQDVLADVVQWLPEEKTQTFHALLKQLRTLAGSQIRNMASLGGHILSRHPDSDLNPLLAAGSCTLCVLSKEGERQIPLDEHFLSRSPSADLKPQEVLLSMTVPYSRKWEFVSAFRQAQRRENAQAIVNAGMRVFFGEGDGVITELSILYGNVGPAAICARDACRKLVGRSWSEETLDEACRLVLGEVTIPGSAPGGRVEFRRTLLVSFLFRFYLQVSQGLSHMDPGRYPSLVGKYESALEDLHPEHRHGRGTFRYQNTDPKQLPQDPIGRPVMHLSGVKHATGEAVYCDDMPAVDQELFLTFVTSSRAHAAIVSMDLSEALSLPGVVDIVTSKHLGDVNSFSTETLLATDKVLCVGHLVCAIIADSEVQAKQAAEKVRIVYKDLEPLILTVEEAVQHKSFFEGERKLECGDVEEAFKTVDQVLEGEVHMGGQEHFYMETQSMLAIPKAEDQEMDIYVSTQFPKYIQHSAWLVCQHTAAVCSNCHTSASRDSCLKVVGQWRVLAENCCHSQDIVASTLKLPANKVMCHVRRVGGAFGGKVIKTSIMAAITAFAAHKHGRAVRCVLERGEDMLITGGRHPYLGKYKVGFMNDGRIVALDMEHYNNGGNSLDESLFVLEMGLLKMENAYKFPHLRCRGRACRTNLPSNTALRGFGFPQAGFVTESCIEEVAAKCGLSPEEVREVNMYKGTKQTPYGQEINTEGLAQCWRECKAQASFSLRRAAVERFNAGSAWKKRGLAMVPLKFPVGVGSVAMGQASALVHVYLDGSVLVTHGGIEMGQGVHTKMIQVVSRELKMPMANVHLRGTSTETVPNANASGGSVVADLNGLAVKDACQTLLKRLEPIISKNPQGAWKDWAQAAFDGSISLSAIGYFRGYESNIDWEKGQGHPFEYCVYGAACSEVEIDCLTGNHKNIRTDIVMDVGHSINPALDRGQVEGAFIQGMGLYTSEELKYSPRGSLHTRGPDQYKIPGVCDIPTELHISFLPPSENSNTLYSSKGLGESGIFLGCSVLFAIRDAVRASRQERCLPGTVALSSPLTPEKIRMACEDRFTKMIPRDIPGSCVPWDVLV